jgi:ferritin-like metal-binding protein YciE
VLAEQTGHLLVQLTDLFVDQSQFLQRHFQQPPVDGVQLRTGAERVAQLFRRGAQARISQSGQSRRVGSPSASAFSRPISCQFNPARVTDFIRAPYLFLRMARRGANVVYGRCGIVAPECQKPNTYGEISMQINRLKHLYIEELKDLYNAENQLVKALPKMAKVATAEDLRAGFEEHLEQTKGHVERLEKIFKALGESPKGKKCKGMEGLIKEGAEMIAEDPATEELDAGLISAAQRVEHYEIAGYGCVATYANLLGEGEAESLLRQTLGEEKETDKKLTQLAEHINLEAEQAVEPDGGNAKGKAMKAKAARA